MPKYIRYSTAKKADYLGVSRNGKCIICDIGKETKFYPNSSYNRQVIFSSGNRFKDRY